MEAMSTTRIPAPKPKKLDHLNRSEKTVAGVALFAWLSFFIAGALVPTAGYRRALEAFWTLSFWEFTTAASVVILCYTLTNCFILAGLSATLGTIGTFVRLEPGRDNSGTALDLVNPYISSIIRAFFSYVVVIAGSTIVSQEPVAHFLEATPEQYLRLALLMSLIGFLVGYNPEVFGTFLKSGRRIAVGDGEGD
jgi:hypothetical protein